MKNVSYKKLLLPVSLVLFSLSFQLANGQWTVRESALKESSLKKVHQTDPHLVHVIPDKEWDQSNFASAEDLEWFKNAKYGMFIHFGLSTFKNVDLSWGMISDRVMPDVPADGLYTKDVWSKFSESLRLENFSKESFVQILKETKVKYVVVVTKHHDGFHLWDTKYSDFKVTNTPYGKDFIREIVDACHEAEVKVGFYYSQRDWYHPDYCPVDPATADRTVYPPYFKSKEGMEAKPGENHQKYIDYQFDVIRELCTNYGKIDLFWLDAFYWNGMFTADMWDAEALTRMIRELQPGTIINNRAGLPGDYDTPEGRIGMFQDTRPWESCLPLCNDWSYTPTPVKTPLEVFQKLQSTAIGDGNLLISWGMKWDGAWDESQKKSLLEVGKYLNKYDQSIFNTRGGIWLPATWGGTTFSQDKIYIHIISKPNSGKISLLKRPDFVLSNSKVLTGQSVSLTETETAYVIDLSAVKSIREPLIIESTMLPTDINETTATPASIVAYYNILGQKLLQEPASGIYIVMYSDGKSVKETKIE